MPEMTLQDLIERCICQDWEDLNPCEVFADLKFPEGDCEGHCARCILEAAGLDNI